jgi:hypothetical protein
MERKQSTSHRPKARSLNSLQPKTPVSNRYTRIQLRRSWSARPLPSQRWRSQELAATVRVLWEWSDPLPVVFNGPPNSHTRTTFIASPKLRLLIPGCTYGMLSHLHDWRPQPYQRMKNKNQHYQTLTLYISMRYTLQRHSQLVVDTVRRNLVVQNWRIAQSTFVALLVYSAVCYFGIQLSNPLHAAATTSQCQTVRIMPWVTRLPLAKAQEAITSTDDGYRPPLYLALTQAGYRVNFVVENSLAARLSHHLISIMRAIVATHRGK